MRLSQGEEEGNEERGGEKEGGREGQERKGRLFNFFVVEDRRPGKENKWISKQRDG